MQTVVLVQRGILELRTSPIPAPPPGGAVLEVTACGLCGTDLRCIFGYDDRTAPPWVLGHEVVGRVMAVESGASFPAGIAHGDRVILPAIMPCRWCAACQRGRLNRCEGRQTLGFRPHPGGFAQCVSVPAHGMQGLLRVPDELDDATAALVDTAAVVRNGTRFLGDVFGSSAAVLGAGPVGTIFTLMLAVSGARCVTLVDPNDGRLARSLAVLADAVPSTVLGSTASTGLRRQPTERAAQADIVVVANSSADSQAQALEICAPGGRVLLFGGLADGDRPRLDTNLIHYRELTVLGSSGAGPIDYQEALAFVTLHRHTLSRLVTRKLPLSRLPQALDEFGLGDDLKTVVIPPRLSGVP